MIVHWQRDRDPIALVCIVLAAMGFVTFFAGWRSDAGWLWLAAVLSCFVYSLAGMIHYRRTAR